MCFPGRSIWDPEATDRACRATSWMKINYQHDETLMWDSVTDMKIDSHEIWNVDLDTIEYHIRFLFILKSSIIMADLKIFLLNCHDLLWYGYFTNPQVLNVFNIFFFWPTLYIKILTLKFINSTELYSFLSYIHSLILSGKNINSRFLTLIDNDPKTIKLSSTSKTQMLCILFDVSIHHFKERNLVN